MSQRRVAQSCQRVDHEAGTYDRNSNICRDFIRRWKQCAAKVRCVDRGRFDSARIDQQPLGGDTDRGVGSCAAAGMGDLVALAEGP